MATIMMKRKLYKVGPGYEIHGQFGSIMLADHAKQVTYSNLVPDSDEYKELTAMLANAD